MMDCSNLAATGPDIGYLLAIAALIVLTGVTLLIVGRRRRSVRVGVLAVLMLAVAVCVPIGGVPSAQAAAINCVVDPGPANSLTIVQTSTMTGLAPNVEPTAITGRVTNNSADDTYIVEIVASILGVTKASGAAPGVCDATDYVLVEPVMPVNEALAGGASTTFSGASIGFADKVTNQDACKGATVTLLYTTG